MSTRASIVYIEDEAHLYDDLSDSWAEDFLAARGAPLARPRVFLELTTDTFTVASVEGGAQVTVAIPDDVFCRLAEGYLAQRRGP